MGVGSSLSTRPARRSWYARRSSSKSSPSLRQPWICPCFSVMQGPLAGVLEVYTSRHVATNPCFFNPLQAQKRLTESTGLHYCSAQSLTASCHRDWAIVGAAELL